MLLVKQIVSQVKHNDCRVDKCWLVHRPLTV